MTRNKKIIIIAIIVVSLMAIGLSIWYLVFYNYEPTGPIGGGGVQGIVVDVSLSAKVITVFDSAENKGIYLALTDDTKLFDEHRFPVNLSYFQIGFVVEAFGEMTNENSLIPSEVYITKATQEGVELIPPDFFIPSFNEEGKMEFKVQEGRIELLEYGNPQLGFSMKIPLEVSGLYKCPFNETILVPVKVFEDNENGIVYVSQEYYYKAEWDSELQEFTGPCEKITYSLESLKSETVNNMPFLGWAILIKDIKDENELDKFIKEIYGSGCSAGQKTPWAQSGVYEIPVLADGTDLGNTTCPVGWMNSKKVLYAPEKDKFMSVILGQECTFGTNPYSKPYQCYDEGMINSFEFKEESRILTWEEQINAPSILPSGEILGTVDYCTTACDDTYPGYCSPEPREERNLKIQLRNLYNNNIIYCYLLNWVDSKSSIMMGMGQPPRLSLNKEAFDKLRGNIIHSVGIKYLK